MNFRFRLSAKVWLLTAATGMVLGPAFVLLGQTDSRQRTSTARQRVQLRSAVQRELDKLYAQDGRRAPSMTTKDALQNLQQSTPARQTAPAQTPSKSSKRTWFDKLISAPAPARAPANSARILTQPRTAASRPVEARQLASQRRQTVAQPRITQTGQSVSQSVSSAQSVTVVKKGTSTTAVKSPSVPLIQRKARPSKPAAAEVKKSESKSVKPPRLLHSLAEKTAQLINRSGNKDAETQQPAKPTAAAKSPASKPTRGVSSKSRAGRRSQASRSRTRRNSPAVARTPRTSPPKPQVTAAQSKPQATRPKPQVTQVQPKQTRPKPQVTQVQPKQTQPKAQVTQAAVQPAVVQPVAKSQVSVAQSKTTQKAKPSSEIMRQLEQLYKRDGRTMPPMNLKQPVVTKNSKAKRSVPLKPTPTQPKTADVRQSASPASFLKRIFQLDRKRKSPPRPQQRIVNRNMQHQNLPQSKIPASVTPPPPGRVVNPSAKKLAPGSIASTLSKKPTGDAKIIVKPKIAKAQPANKTAGPSARAQATGKENPFRGLKLTDNQPKPAKLIPDDAKTKEKSASKKRKSEKEEQKVASKSQGVGPQIKPLVVPNPRSAAKPSSNRAEKEFGQSDMEQHADKYQQIASRGGLKGLKGFCPVALRDKRELVDAKPEFRYHFNAIAYDFSSAEALASFKKNPVTYAPVAGGNDVVLLARTRVEIEGALDYAVWYKDRLYLFTSSETRQVFVGNPREYVLFQ